MLFKKGVVFNISNLWFLVEFLKLEVREDHELQLLEKNYQTGAGLVS